jgi:hypothetical protein
MSEQTPSSPDATPPPSVAATSPADPATGKTRKKVNWPRRVRRLIVALFLLVAIARILAAAAFPIVLNRVAAFYNLKCNYDRFELSALGGDAGLWHLTFTPLSGGNPIFIGEYVRADISTLDLFRGELDVWRVEADGVTVNVDRNADGSIPLLKLLGTAAAPSSASSPSATPSSPVASAAPAKPINLAPPLRIDALRLTHIRTHIHDAAVPQPFDADLTLNFRLTDLGYFDRPLHYAIDLDAGPILDALHVEGDAKANEKSVDATLSANIAGFRPRPLEPYLRALGVLPTANDISLKAAGELKLAQASDPTKLCGSLDLTGLSATADAQEAAGLDHLSIKIDSLDLRTIKLASLSIDQARLTAARHSDGRFRFAGMEFIGAPPSASPPAPASTASIALPTVSLAALDLQRLHTAFLDDAVVPAAALEVDAQNVSVKNIVLDPQQPDAKAQFSGEVIAPGLFQRASFHGSATPMAAKKTLGLQIDADGIAPTRLDPYFKLLNLESRLHNGHFACGIEADLSLPTNAVVANLKLDQIKFSDGDDLFLMNAVAVSDARLQLSPPRIVLKDIELDGPSLPIHHEADGALSAFGLATRTAEIESASSSSAAQANAPAAPQSGPEPATAPSGGITLPAVELDHFAWKGIDVRYADDSLQPPISTRLSEAGVELENILLDLSSAATQKSQQPGTIHAFAIIPQLIDRIDVSGTVTPAPSAVDCQLKAAGTGFTANLVKPFLTRFGIETTLQNGAFNADLTVHGSATDGVSLAASQIRYADGDRELAGIDRFQLGNSTLDKTGLHIGKIEIDRPRIHVAREADNALAAMGVRWHPPAASAAAAAAPTGATAAPVAFAPRPSTMPSEPLNLSLAGIAVKDARLDWSDAAVAPAISTAAVASFQLDPCSIGAGSQPAALHADARIDGSLDSARLDGTLTPSLTAPELDWHVVADGIRAGKLAAYLPTGISVPLKSGHFQTAFTAGVAPNPAGGYRAAFSVSDLDYRDAGDTEPLLAVGSFGATASRLDPAGRTFLIEKISSDRVETAARRTPAGEIGLLGIAIKPDAAQPAPAATEPAEQAAAAQPPTAAAPVSVAELVAQAREAAPVLRINTIDLNLKRLALADDMRPAAKPLVVSDLRFRNTAPLDWGGKDAQSHPPTPFRMDCTVDPIIGAVTLTAQIAPLASSPTLAADLVLADIRGDGVTDLVPELSPYIDGSSLQRGLFHAHADTQFRVARRGAWEVDLEHGFSTDVDIKDIAYRASPGSPILAGVEDIHSDAIRIVPATADVHVKTLEIDNITGRVVREKDGVHALGLVVKIPTGGAKGQAADATQPAAVAIADKVQPAGGQASAVTTAPRPTGEIRVDQLLISGIDFKAEDHTMTPPLYFPLNSLDVEVRDFTTLAPYEDRPIRFNAMVNAGKVPLPRKAYAAEAPTAPGSPAAAISAQSPEERELFAQASANGQLSLYPQPHGWVKTSVSGLELAALKGAAHEAGITLTGGVYDSTADARLPGDGQIHTSSRFVFTDLSISEPPQGPIFRILHLPAPLDVVVGALQDQEGSITVPIDVPVPVQIGKLSTSQLLGPAIGAFGSIVATAIASAPMKAVGGVGDLLGLGGNKQVAPEAPIVLPFEPGSASLSPENLSTIATIVKRMKEDDSLNLVVRHDLGGGDLAVGNERANPSLTDAQNLAEQVREQQLIALQRRSILAGVARAQLAWGSGHDADGTLAQLRALDQQIAMNDDAMDRLYGILRPGADRQAARRTRGACLEYARARLDAIKAALQADGLKDLDRVHLSNPQFSQASGNDGGKITITLVPKQKS